MRGLSPVLVLLVSVAGCITPDGLLEDQPCPCIDGWTCDESRVPRVCVRGDDAGTVDAVPIDTGDGLRDGEAEDGDGLDGFIPDGDPNDASDAGPLEPPPPPSRQCWVQTETCDWTLPGFRFEEVADGNFTDYSAGNVAFSPDACRLLFANSLSGDQDVYLVERTEAGGEFGSALEIVEVNTNSAEDAPSLGPDVLELFLASDRDASGLRRVHRFSRPEGGNWDPNGVPIATLQIAGSTGWEPRLAPHGLRLYVALELPDLDQWVNVVERPEGGEFGEPRRISFDFPAGSNTNRPSVTHDDRILVFIQQLGDASATRRAYYSTRPNWNAPWSAPGALPAGVGADGMRDIGVSPDGCELVVRTTPEAGAVAAILRYIAP